MIAHEAACERQFLPLAETHFDSAGPGRAELRLEAGIQMRDHVVGAGAIDGGNDGRLVVEPRDVAETDRVARLKFEAEKILERARDVLAPIVNGNPREVHSIYKDTSVVGLIEPRQQLDQRTLARAVLADDRNHRPLLEIEAHIFEHVARGPWICERHMLEADAVNEAV